MATHYSCGSYGVRIAWTFGNLFQDRELLDRLQEARDQAHRGECECR